MKLKIRTLSNAEVEVEIEPEATLSQLKQKVAQLLPQMEASRQMLIHQGKILVDSKTLADYPNIKPDDRLVVLVPKTAPKVASESAPKTVEAESSRGEVSQAVPLGEQSSTTATPAAVQPSDALPPVTQEPTTVSGTDSTAAAVSAPERSTERSTEPQPSASLTGESALVMGAELETVISNICALGFERPQVQQALRAAFNNPDRAVEYLMNSQQQQQQRTATPATASPVPSPAADAESHNPAGQQETTTGGALSVLREHPFFEQIRTAVQANPHLLPGILQTIHSQNPELAELIVNNQSEFLQLMSEGATNVAPGVPQMTPGVQVTREQQEAVNRLEALGFSEAAAVQALIDRAANFLFDNMGDFEDDETEDVSHT